LRSCRFFRMLSLRGAKPNLIDGYGRNIFHYGVFNKLETMQACLEVYDPPSSTPHSVCSLTHTSGFSIKRPHIALSTIDKQGMTPVGYCCMKGNFDVLNVIWPIYIESVSTAQRKAHINRRDSCGTLRH